jgi:hypothetical protein
MERQQDYRCAGDQRIDGLPGAPATGGRSRKQRAMPAVPPIFDGEKEAKLIALACSNPPKGRGRWTLRLLEEKVVELNLVERRQRLNDRSRFKKNTLKPHHRQQWVIPPRANSAFV